MHNQNVDLRDLGFDTSKPTIGIQLNRPRPAMGFLELMTWPLAQRHTVVATDPKGAEEDALATYMLQIKQMVAVMRSGAQVVVTGLHDQFTETQRMEIIGLRITGQVVGLSNGVVETPARMKQPLDYVGYLMFEPDDASPEPLAYRLWLQHLAPGHVDIGTGIQRHDPAEQQKRWRAMGFIGGWVHPLCPLDPLTILKVEQHREALAVHGSRPLVLTTDDVYHRDLMERCSIGLRISHMAEAGVEANRHDVVGYMFTGEITGVAMNSEYASSVPPVNYAADVRGFIEPATPHRASVVWFQIVSHALPSMRERREQETTDITERPLAPQLQ